MPSQHMLPPSRVFKNWSHSTPIQMRVPPISCATVIRPAPWHTRSSEQISKQPTSHMEHLRKESERFAAALARLGVGPGDRVATLMGKSSEYLIALMGIWRLGAVHVPIFTAFAPAGIAFRLIRSQAKVIICDETQQEKLLPGDDIPAPASWKVVTTAAEGAGIPGSLRFSELMSAQVPGRPAARLGGDAPIIQIYTSGTTGTPKGVLVPTKALAGFRAYAEFGLGLDADDLYWCAADPGWAYGLYFGILGSFTTGVPSLLLTAAFDAATTFEVLARYNVTNFTAAPTVYRSMRAFDGPRPKLTNYATPQALVSPSPRRLISGP